MIEDPLPAGFEAVDTSFRTALQAVVPQSNSWQIDTSQIYSDRVVAYAQHLDPGVYELHYLVRSVTPGTFAWPGARAYLQDAPEQFGRSASTSLRIGECNTMECNRAAFLTGSLALATGALARPADSATAPPASATPEMLLGQLMAGNKRFVDNDFPTANRIADKRAMVVEGQAPFASILSCADSRVIPELVFVQGIGQLFVTRVAGNFPDDLVTGSIEYAVEHLGTTVIFVLGHESCGAVKAVYCCASKERTAARRTSRRFSG